MLLNEKLRFHVQHSNDCMEFIQIIEKGSSLGQLPFDLVSIMDDG